MKNCNPIVPILLMVIYFQVKNCYYQILMRIFPHFNFGWFCFVAFFKKITTYDSKGTSYMGNNSKNQDLTYPLLWLFIYALLSLL